MTVSGGGGIIMVAINESMSSSRKSGLSPVLADRSNGGRLGEWFSPFFPTSKIYRPIYLLLVDINILYYTMKLSNIDSKIYS